MKNQTQVFKVDRRLIKAIRISALFATSPGILVAFGYANITDPIAFRDNFSAAAMIWFWFYAAMALTGWLVWSIWRKIPFRAAAGTLTVGPDGVLYDVGPYRRTIPWHEVKGAVTIRPPKRKKPCAIWLAVIESPEVTPEIEQRVGQASNKSFARPLEQPDGSIILPTSLFGDQNAQVILDAIKPYLGP